LSDHKPLTWLFYLKDPLSKLARWQIIKEENCDTFLEKFKTQLITNNNMKVVNETLLDLPKEH